MSAVTLAQTGEDALVRRLRRNLPTRPDVVVGAGDDCAVVRSPGRGWWELLKTDCVVEGVHFSRGMDLGRVGWKALARAASDIAAMGGEPAHALVTLLAPPGRKVADMARLYRGLCRCARRLGISIVGGETSRAPRLAVAVSLAGRVRAARCIRRDGAKAGDVILVTGKLGGSRGGHHLDFMPRLREGQWLAKQRGLHAMMDLSDGLARDLPRMARASGLDFVIQESALPLRAGCSPQKGWADGEDYELLLAVKSGAAAGLEHAWRRRFPKLPLTRIGSFVAKGKGQRPSFAAKGWEHF